VDVDVSERLGSRVTLTRSARLPQDAALGPNWYDSDIYGERWYGSVDNTDGRVDGRYRNVSAVRDTADAHAHSYHNPYGLETGEYDMTDDSHLVRTNQFCGYTNTQACRAPSATTPVPPSVDVVLHVRPGVRENPAQCRVWFPVARVAGV
jgi:hypothetical protein